jgi:hypothetical protein
MEPLKVGDKVYLKEAMRYSNFITYKIATVERLTKTQAILSNKDKVINEPKLTGYIGDKIIGFEIYGDRWKHYHILTDEIMEEAKIQSEKIKAHNWFIKKNFTNEEEELIYKYFSQLNKL